MTQNDPFHISISRLGRVVHAVQFSEGLNPAQWEALRFLARANRQSATPGAMASYLNATKGTVSQTLIALEQKALVVRGRCDQDRRVVRLALTDAGKEMLERDPLNCFTHAAESVNGADRARLTQIIGELAEGMCGQQGGTAFGKCTSCCHRSCEGEGKESVCNVTGQPLCLEDLEKICVDYCFGDENPR